MIAHTINSYRFPFISSQNKVVQGYDYKTINVTQPGTYAKSDTEYNIFITLENSCVISRLMNEKKVQISSEGIKHIFNGVQKLMLYEIYLPLLAISIPNMKLL